MCFFLNSLCPEYPKRLHNLEKKSTESLNVTEAFVSECTWNQFLSTEVSVLSFLWKNNWLSPNMRKPGKKGKREKGKGSKHQMKVTLSFIICLRNAIPPFLIHGICHIGYSI